MTKQCIRCGKVLSVGANSLCLDCYSTRKSWQPRKVFICRKCGNATTHYAKQMCKPCYMAEYGLNHHPEHTAKEKKRREIHAEHIRELDRQRNRSDNRQAWKREYRKAYYEQNKERLQAYNREWMRTHKEEMNHHHAVRTTRKKQLPVTLTRAEWQEILIENGNRCFYCGTSSVVLHKEHKIPISRGGGLTRDNIVPACGSCNSQKSFRTPEEFEQYLKEKGKYRIKN